MKILFPVHYWIIITPTSQNLYKHPIIATYKGYNTLLITIPFPANDLRCVMQKIGTQIYTHILFEQSTSILCIYVTEQNAVA